MSRRSRKRRGGGGGSNKWLIALVAVFVVFVIAAGTIHTMIRRYLQSDEFRVFLSEKVSEAIQVEGSFKPLKWDGLAVSSDGFVAEGEGPIRSLNIEGLRTEVGLGGFWRGVWEVQGFQVRQVDVEIDARSGSEPAIAAVEKPAAASAKKEKDGWLPREVEVQSMTVDRLSVKALLDSGPLTLKGVRMKATPGSGKQAYEVKLTDGDLTLPGKGLPKVHLEEADLRFKDGAVFLSHAEAGVWDRGRIELTAEWDPALDVRGAQGSVSKIDCSKVLNEDWTKRIRGELATDFNVTWLEDEPVASGHLVLQNGVVTGLPILEVMEAYLDTTRFRMLTLSQAETDWRWKEGQWSVSNLVIASEGLLRIEGQMHVVGEKIDGNFQVGLAPGTLARIPGAEKHVFLAGKDGLRWAPVRVTGTLDDPQHDLTGRLIKAAGRRLLEALPEATLKTLLLGKDVIDASTQKAVQEGIKLLEGGPALLEKISDGLLKDGLKLPTGGDGGADPVGGLLKGLLDGF